MLKTSFTFTMNGYLWRVKFVEPSNPYLIDRTNSRRVATTDSDTKCIYLSNDLSGEYLRTVFIHELGHCALYSFDLLYDIHKMVKKEFWIDAEEWVCNFIADYGIKIFEISYSMLGDKALVFIPHEIERLIS